MTRLPLLMALALFAAPADACRCAQRNLADYFSAADEVVTAKLVAAAWTDDEEARELALEFELLAPPYRSDRRLAAGDRISYLTAASSAACGIAPEEGAVYVLFAQASGATASSTLQVNTCSGTRVLLATDGQEPEGFQDVPAQFIPKQLNALAGLEVLAAISAANPDPDDRNNEELVGLLDVAGFSHAGHALLLNQPNREAKQVAQLEGYEELVSREVGYEVPAAVVYAKADGWYRLKTANGRFGWLSPEYAGTYIAYKDLLIRRLGYLPLPWHGFVWPSPGAGLPVRVLSSDGQRHQPVEVLESTNIGGSLWFRVNVLKENPCEGGDSTKGTGGWIPGYRKDGAPVAWFYSRGC